MKIQITNLFFLSTVLLFISGCQELEQINLYNQSNLPPKNHNNKKGNLLGCLALIQPNYYLNDLNNY